MVRSTASAMPDAFGELARRHRDEHRRGAQDVDGGDDDAGDDDAKRDRAARVLDFLTDHRRDLETREGKTHRRPQAHRREEVVFRQQLGRGERRRGAEGRKRDGAADDQQGRRHPRRNAADVLYPLCGLEAEQIDTGAEPEKAQHENH